MIRGFRLINWQIFVLVVFITFSSGAFQALSAENVSTIGTYSVIAVSEGNTINLSWSTTSETNSDYFIVQKSKDGILFDDVMQELAAGNSSEVKSYSVTDYKPFTGPSYYRVVEVDAEGNIAHTVSTVANFEMELSMTVSPGNSGNAFDIAITSKKQKQVLLVVRDMQGKEFYSKVVILRSVDEIVAIEPEGKLSLGIYTIVASSNNAIYSKKIMITK